MKWQKLAVDGVIEFAPERFSDARGSFLSSYQESVFVDAVGHPLFPVAQTSYSRSRRGTVRGVHFTATPPGIAKYVYCAYGSALDLVVDIRPGSPTFGRWDSVALRPDQPRALYLPTGVGHAFVALEDDTIISYLLSGEYVAGNELALSVLDPAMGLPIPDDIVPVLSDRDRLAPTLSHARQAGMLPDYAECLRLEEKLRRQ